jgi:chromosome segregation ATPase
VSRTVLALALALGGCASWPPVTREPAQLLLRADTLVEREDYAAALVAYEELVGRHPASRAADRARIARSLVAALVAARDEIARQDREMASDRAVIAQLEAGRRRSEAELGRLARELAVREGEIVRAREELAAREGEIGRTREELAARQSELAKLTAEAERLRSAIEDLKRLELELERRR